MFYRTLALLVFPFLAATANADTKEESNGASKKWTVSLHETAFYDYHGTPALEIPRGADGYKTSDTLLVPNLGLGYALNKDWSVEAFLQVGPRSSFAVTSDRSESHPRTEFASDFASVVASREFRIGERLYVAPKFGIAYSSLDYKRADDKTDFESWSKTGFDPVVSLEVGRPITESMSMSLDYTRYFIDEKDLNSTIRLGVRFRF